MLHGFENNMTSNGNLTILEQKFIDNVSSVIENKLINKLDEKLNILLNNNKKTEIEPLEKYSVDQLFSKLANLIEKQTRHKNNESILNEHLKNKTAPKALFTNRFPRPLLSDNQKHVQGHDKLIQQMQVMFIQFNLEC